MINADIETALQEIADRNDGRLTPEQVVETARDPASPLHDQFTWDDTEAARKHRENEARTLIRSVTIVVTNRTLTFNVPKYVRDPTLPAKQQGYLNVTKVKTDADIARDTILREFDRARAALTRAQGIAAFLGIEDEVAGLSDMVAAIARKAGAEREAGNA